VSVIDAVIFDLGNVLLEVDETRALQRICARTGRTPREVEHYFVSTPFGVQLSLGELSKKKFYEIVARDLPFDGSYEEFASIWSEIFTPIEPMVALATELKGRMPRFILSNTNAIHMDYIFANYPFMRAFNGYVLSYEVGLMKPDPRIYELALQKFGLAAGQTAFVDDILANVESARNVGLRAVHYQNAGQAREELTKLAVAPI
jgi:FMN phosphatase YigB (HAD superfamily)